MKTIIRFLNFISFHLFGELSSGDQRVWFHWQNLSDDARNGRKGIAWEGRAWCNCRHQHRKRTTTLKFEWNFKSRLCGASFCLNQNICGPLFHVALPPISLWFGIEGLISYHWMHKHFGYKNCETAIGIHDCAIWWNIWRDNMGWDSKVPKWRSGSFHFDRFFLGSPKYSRRELSKHEVQVPLPEGNYPGTVTLVEDTWKRPRWFTKRVLRASIDMHKPAPFPGKGENSWDCGDDALYGLSCRTNTVEGAIAAYIEAVMRERRRHGGGVMMRYPPPSTKEALNGLDLL